MADPLAGNDDARSNGGPYRQKRRNAAGDIAIFTDARACIAGTGEGGIHYRQKQRRAAGIASCEEADIFQEGQIG